MKKNSSLLVALSMLVALCTNTCKNNSPVTKKLNGIKDIQPVTFTVTDSAIFKDKSIVFDFYYHDSLGHGHPFLLNNVETKLIIPGPELLLQSDALQTPFYICPGEHILVGLDSVSGLMFSVKGNAVRSNELLLTKRLVKEKGVLYGFAVQALTKNNLQNMDTLEAMEKYILAEEGQRLAFIDTFKLRHPISPTFNNIAHSIVANAAICERQFLLWRNKNLASQNNVWQQKMQTCIKQLNSEKDSDILSYMGYYALCDNLGINTTKFMGDLVFDSADYEKKYAFVNNNFVGAPKAFLLTNITAQAIEKQIAISTANMQAFYAVCSNDTYKNLIKEKIQQEGDHKYPKGSSNLLSYNGKAPQDIQAVLASQKGKLVLLDFWASWCSPCRAEMPYSHLLKQQYTGKGITFMYIAQKDDPRDWKNASIEEGIGAENNYLLLNPETSSFVAQNNIHSIPRFMLIGKDGKILAYDAPRPSDIKLKELLDRYLK